MFESLQILMSTADTYKCIMDGSPFHLMEKSEQTDIMNLNNEQAWLN